MFGFNVKRGKQTREQIAFHDRIARRHGCVYVYVYDPGNGWMGWYEGPNRGFPFDSQLAKAISEDERSQL